MTDKGWARMFARILVGIIFFMAGWWKCFELTPLQHARGMFVDPTLMAIHTNLFHFGMVLVGLPYSWGGQMILHEVTGGAPYGTPLASGHGAPLAKAQSRCIRAVWRVSKGGSRCGTTESAFHSGHCDIPAATRSSAR